VNVRSRARRRDGTAAAWPTVGEEEDAIALLAGDGLAAPLSCVVCVQR
jgi:hypothetical protein